MVKGRHSNVENNGAGQTGRQENRQGIEAFTRRNQRDGCKARDILKHARIDREGFWNAFGSRFAGGIHRLIFQLAAIVGKTIQDTLNQARARLGETSVKYGGISAR